MKLNDKTLIEHFGEQGIKLSINPDNFTLQFTGIKNQKQKDEVLKNKELIMIELIGEEPTDEQQKKLLIRWGYSVELADLIVWAWENDHKWPIVPFSFSFTKRGIRETMNILDHKQFYMDIGRACISPDHDWVQNGYLKAYLEALKLLVEGDSTNER